MLNQIKDMDERASLEYLVAKSKEFGLSALCSVILGDIRFPIWSGASKEHQHNYGRGGLAVHTAEVVTLCLNNNAFFGNPVDQRKVFLAALFHDCGKMWDYAPSADGVNWISTKHKRHIHHISRSALVFKEATLKYPVAGMTEEVVDEILHAILSHHGLREWGSPVAPNSKLAWLLHLCDNIAARLTDCETWDRIKD